MCRIAASSSSNRWRRSARNGVGRPFQSSSSSQGGRCHRFSTSVPCSSRETASWPGRKSMRSRVMSGRAASNVWLVGCQRSIPPLAVRYSIAWSRAATRLRSRPESRSGPRGAFRSTNRPSEAMYAYLAAIAASASSFRLRNSLLPSATGRVSWRGTVGPHSGFMAVFVIGSSLVGVVTAGRKTVGENRRRPHGHSRIGHVSPSLRRPLREQARGRVPAGTVLGPCIQKGGDGEEEEV